MYNELDGSQQVELLAESLRANTSDLDIYLEVLATKLTNILPGQTTVTRHASLFSANHPVKEVRVAFGQYHYVLHREKQGPILAQRTTIVGGIILKKEPLTIPQWIDEVASMLAQEAAQSAQTRSALEQFLL